MSSLVMCLWLLSFLVFLASPIWTANILFVAITPSYNHQIVYQSIWKELSLRGHQVHVITTHPLNDPVLVNLTEIDVSSIYTNIRKSSTRDFEKFMLKKPDFVNIFQQDISRSRLFNKFADEAFSHQSVRREFLHQNKHHFDLAIIEWTIPTMAVFGAKFQCPIVGISSSIVPIPGLDTIGNPDHPVYAPDRRLPFSRPLAFKERLIAAIYSVYARLYNDWVVLPRDDRLIKKHFGEEMPYLGDIQRNISVLLVNRNPILHGVLPLVPAVVEMGNGQLKRPQREMTPELKQFLNESTLGVIYFDLSSDVFGNMLNGGIQEIFRETFAQLPYNVVWKWENQTLAGKPDNVFIQEWLPQHELLSHPNMKLFITQGGLQAIEDAINNHLPIIGLPFHADQAINIDTCVEYGLGIAVDLEDLTVEKLNSTIYKIINDKSFKQNGVKLAELLQDQPMDGLDKAIWWIEYVIRHKGARHLRSPTLEISWIIYYLLDVMAFLLISLIIAVFLAYYFTKAVIGTFLELFHKFLPKDRSKKCQ